MVTAIAIFIILILGCFIAVANRKDSRAQEASMDAFMAREQEANRTRKKPLDDIEFISIPVESLPMETLTEDPEILDCVRTVRELSTQKIANLTMYTNTDLKLRYGTANITVLTEYDSAYILLVQKLRKWAEALEAKGCVTEAATVRSYRDSIDPPVSIAPLTHPLP